MEPDLAQLRALQAVVDCGSFEAAATRLRVTPSAVSQRIRALESAVGQVLLVRSRPVVVTAAGEPVLRLAREIALLVADVTTGLDPAARPEVSVAVNADSLSTWFLPSVAPLRADVVLVLHRADQDRTEAMLRDGTVSAAVTTAREPVPGCSSHPLGVLRYRPVAAPELMGRCFADGVTADALRRAPVVTFDGDDSLQDVFLTRRARGVVRPPRHRVPATDAFEAAVLAGFGWGMFSELQLARLPTGAVVPLDPRASVDVRLYWQRWKLGSRALDRVGACVLEHARTALRPGPRLQP